MQPASCAGQKLPGALLKSFGQAHSLVQSAELTTAKKTKKLITKANKDLKRAVGLVNHGAKKHTLSPDCVTALLHVLGNAQRGAQGCCGAQ